MNKENRPIQSKQLLTTCAIIFVALMLSTFSVGLLWCRPDAEDNLPPASPVGTWVHADDWEAGSSPDDIIITFTETGLMTISVNSFSALYIFEDNTLKLFDIDEDTDALPDNANHTAYKCIITGDHMTLMARIAGLAYAHGHTDLIRVSGETDLTYEQLSELY